MSAIPTHSFDQDFKFQKVLGKVYHLADKRRYAIKQIITESTQEFCQAFNEVELLKVMQDPRITRIFYYYMRHIRKSGNYQLGIIMDLCQSNLLQAIKERKKTRTFFSKEEIQHFVGSMIPFLAKMQRKGYVHRDIKPENILLNKGKQKLQYKLGDFGFAVKLNTYSHRNVAGTMQYVSPKLLVKFKNNKVSVSGHNIKDDVYSFGKTLSEMMALQIGQPFTVKKLNECKERYGKELAILVDYMLVESEPKRADFVFLQKYLSDLNLINSTDVSVQEQKIPLRSYSRNSVNRCLSTPRTHLKQFDNSTSTECPTYKPSKPKKKKYYFQTKEFTELKIQNAFEDVPIVKQEAEHFTSPDQSKIQLWRRTTSIKFKQIVTCLEVCDQLLFLGMEDKLGTVVVATQKLSMLTHHQSLKKISCLKVSADQQKLFIGTLNSKIYCIPIVQLKKFIVNNKSFKINNTIELSLSCLLFKQITLSAPISTFYIDPNSNKSAHSIIAGHHTGQISVISNNNVERKLTIVTEPITCLALKDGYLYTSSANGIFKRQKALSIGIIGESAEQGSLLSSQAKFPNIFYKCDSPIITFEIIFDCKHNQDVSNKNNHYLAALVEYGGFLHIVSVTMKCERKIRVSHNNMLAAYLKIKEDSNCGAEGFFIDQQGMLTNEEGTVLKKTEQKGITCLGLSSQNIFCSGFGKKLLIMGFAQDTIELQ